MSFATDIIDIGVCQGFWKTRKMEKCIRPVSNEISDLCEISDLLLFLSYFASQNKEIKPGNYFFDVCCVN